MATFTPPTTDNRGPISLDPRELRSNPLGYRLFRHYRKRTSGENVFKMSDGTYVTSPPGSEPYPATDAVPNNALARSWYEGVETVFSLPTPYVVLVYYGGHSYQVTAAEAAALTAAGFGAYLS